MTLLGIVLLVAMMLIIGVLGEPRLTNRDLVRRMRPAEFISELFGASAFGALTFLWEVVLPSGVERTHKKATAMGCVWFILGNLGFLALGATWWQSILILVAVTAVWAVACFALACRDQEHPGRLW